MNFRGSKKQEFEIFSNSFGDIMFFLMLFFLIASTMITPGAIKLSLPQANQTKTMQQPPKEVSISITKDLKYYINNDEVQFSEIEPSLLMFQQKNKELIVLVRCDNDISVQTLVDVFQIGNKTKIKMVLATTRKD